MFRCIITLIRKRVGLNCNILLTLLANLQANQFFKYTITVIVNFYINYKNFINEITQIYQI